MAQWVKALVMQVLRPKYIRKLYVMDKRGWDKPGKWPRRSEVGGTVVRGNGEMRTL